MKKPTILFLLTLLMTNIIQVKAANPLLQQFNTPYGTAPFDKIEPAHFEEAILLGIGKANEEINSIATNPAQPTFDNTIVALERAGSDLTRALNIFFPLTSALSSPEIMEITTRIMPQLSDYETSVILNEDLWKRVKAVYDSREKLNLDTEDAKLLENTYNSFAHSGANLVGDDRQKYQQLQSELSALTTSFGQNVLKELNTYKIWMDDAEVDGLPQDNISSALEAAKGEVAPEGKKYLLTLDAPVYSAFMKYANRRDMRQKMYMLYSSRNTKGEFSNLGNMTRIAEIRRQIANLLGSPTFAAHNLRRSMARTPENVMGLLNQLRDAYRPALEAEMAELNSFASELEGHPFEIQPWDYSYYSNKLKNSKYAYDEEQLRPYFQLENVIDGVFGLATKLYGIHFRQDTTIAVYHPDVKAFQVTDSLGNYVGIIYTDFFPRDTKRSGAWMTEFASQYIGKDGKDNRPHVSIVMNFTKPTADKPSLLTPYEVETFLHEFGHALHGLLTQCKYASLSGTNVYRDFVELPSQFNENYLTEKEFLDSFARHYQTGEKIPQEQIDKLIKAQQYGAAYACMRQLMFGFIDMGWHNRPDSISGDPFSTEYDSYSSVAIFPAAEGTLVSPQFTHIFSGGYAAGYYSYKWAEVLDADAFAHFKENGIFDRQTANSFLNNILKKGGTENPAVLYRRFRGQEPTIDALLIRDGIKK